MLCLVSGTLVAHLLTPLMSLLDANFEQKVVREILSQRQMR